MIAENIKNIEENIEKCCFRLGKTRNSVRLIAVSKTFGADSVKQAVDAGISDFGENYVQELIEKRKTLLDLPIRWHFIGHLQSNKVKYIAEWISMIHSVDSEKLAQEINKQAQKYNKTIDVLVEVNTSEEATKFGVKPEKAVEFIKTISLLPSLSLKGLMTIGPFSNDKDESRKSFSLLRSIFEEVNRLGITREPLTELSMGMTHDYETAMEEGATIVRIGTAIFGRRVKKQ